MSKTVAEFELALLKKVTAGVSPIDVAKVRSVVARIEKSGLNSNELFSLLSMLRTGSTVHHIRDIGQQVQVMTISANSVVFTFKFDLTNQDFTSRDEPY